MANKPQNIILHHSVTDRDSNKDVTESIINQSHKDRGFNESYFSGRKYYIGYHYMIFGDGEVRQYRAHSTVGAHCIEENMNFKSIGICLIGNFSQTKPSKEQIASLKALVDKLRSELDIPEKNLFPHRKFKATQCWGTNLPDDPNLLFESYGHWSDKDMDWAVEHGLIKVLKDPNTPVTWGALVVVLRRLAEKVLEWTRTNN